jgi:hypothetical protein
LADELGNLYWQANPEHLAGVYNRIVAGTRGRGYTGHDIGAFCARIDQNDPIPLHLPGPLGIYLSALINGCDDGSITFFTDGLRCTIHFLGYRLPRGKQLILIGNTGDFTGAALNGGTLVVKGSAGDWCGAGMTDGKIHVKKNAGREVGQWMHGGTIRVDGSMQSIGGQRYGGRINSHDEPSVST